MSFLQKIWKKTGRGLGKINYPIRVVGYIVGAGIVFAHNIQYGDFTALSFTFFVLVLFYPHLVYGIYKYFDSDKNIELGFLLFDTFVAGVLINIFHFGLFPSLAIGVAITSNNMITRGARFFLWGLLCLIAGILFEGIFTGFQFEPMTSLSVSLLSGVFMLAFSYYFAYVNFQNTFKMKKTREEMRLSNVDLQRKQLQIKAQTEHIQETNEQLRASEEEIRQNSEELLAINESLAAREIELKEKGESLSKAMEQITSSLNYAKRIQHATLPTDKEIKTALSDSFVFFRPRDIVSGDFYWFSQIEMKAMYEEKEDFEGIRRIFKGFSNEKAVITAIDCTGHGVPGAFMSVIAHDLLDEIINFREMIEPDKILTELNRRVREVLRQEENKGREGMDMALCVLDLDDLTLEFAGAHNPLVLIRDGEIETFKGDKLAIGGYANSDNKNFKKQSIQLKSSDIFYIFTDGYQDQFGGPSKRKFMLKRLRNLFLEIHTKPMEEQKQILDERLEEWIQQGEEKQLDDILVIGVKIPESETE